jgi:hypothetical protein
MAVNAAVQCAPLAAQPENLVGVVNTLLPKATEREKAEYRAATMPCAGCHAQVDAFGLALDAFDGIGRYRTVDSQGRPIDPSVTMPPSFGGVEVANAVEMQRVIAASPVFARCMAKNMMSRMLEQPGLETTSCAVSPVVSGLGQSDGSLSALVDEIAASRAFSERKAE